MTAKEWAIIALLVAFVIILAPIWAAMTLLVLVVLFVATTFLSVYHALFVK